MTSSFYRPELNALRFFAVVLVMCDHVPRPAPWFLPLHEMGIFGLGLFFMLSAYLIVSLLLRERRSTGKIDYKAFVARRILRIWPLYFLGIFLGWFLGHHWPEVTVPRLALVALTLLSANIYVIYHGWTAVGLLAPLWSISIEEQFYLVVPWLGRFGGRKALFYACASILVVSYGTLAWLGAHHAVYISKVWPNSFVQFQFFAAGGMIALWNDRTPNRMNSPMRLACLAGGVIAWYFAVMRFGLHTWEPSTPTHLLAGFTLALVGTTAIFLATLETSVTFSAPLLYLGKISFGIYVFHNLALGAVFSNPDRFHFLFQNQVAGLAVAYSTTVAAAMLSYKFFELPFLRLKKRFEVVRANA